MKKRIVGKKGTERTAIETLIIWILGLVLLGLVLLFIFGYLSPGLTEFGKTGTGIFDALKGIKIGYDAEAAEKPEEKPEDVMEKAKDCEGKIKAWGQLKNDQDKNKQGLEVFEFCINNNECDKAENIDIEKTDSVKFKLADCYIKKGAKQKAEDLIKYLPDELKKLLDVADADKINKLTKLYIDFIDVLKLGTPGFILAEKKISNIRKEVADKLKYKNYIVAAEFLHAENQYKVTRKCTGLENLKRTAPLMTFPIGPYKNEPIESRRLLQLSGCYKQESRDKFIDISNQLILNYELTRAAEEFVKNNKVQCMSMADFQDCHKLNQDLARPTKENKVYKSLRCTYNYRGLGKGEDCGSCENIKKCSDYLSEMNCEEDTCIVNSGEPCFWDWRVLSLTYQCVATEEEKGY